MSIRTAVYRLYDQDTRLLYVGITGNLTIRLRDHASLKPWWPDVARHTVVWHENRADALTEESLAICTENPAHNERGRTRTPQVFTEPQGSPLEQHYEVVPVAKARAEIGRIVDAADRGQATLLAKNGEVRAVLIPHDVFLEAKAAYDAAHGVSEAR